MMEQEILARFLNKQVKITLKNGFFYRGLLVEVTSLSVCLKDVKFKEVWLSLDDVSQVAFLEAQ